MNDIPHDPDRAQRFVQERLTLRQARVLLALHKGGSLSKAADLLHITQPAVSKALTEVERGLGETLYVRRGRNIGTTPLGRRLVDLAQQLETSLRRAADDAGVLARGAAGQVRVGASNAAMARLVPDAIVALKREWPGVMVAVRAESVPAMLQALGRGELDLVVARFVPEAPRVATRMLAIGPQREVVTISRRNPLSRNTRVGWDTLARQPWLWPGPGTRTRDLLNAWWRELQLPWPEDLIETGDLMLKMSLLQRLPLVTLLAADLAQAAAREGIVTLAPFELPGDLGDMTLCTAAAPVPPAVERFCALLKAGAEDAQRDGFSYAAAGTARPRSAV